MKVTIYDQKGKETSSATLNDSVFNADVNEKVLSQYVYAYLSNQRQGNAHTKDRSEVSGTGKKPWRQKGTGRARVGTKQNPLWKGGGVAFGPTNERNWKKQLNKKFKKAAMRQALSAVAQNKALTVIDTITMDSKKPLTKQAETLMKAFNSPKKVTIVTNEVKTDVVRAVSNLQNMQVVYVKDLNVYDVINAGTLMIEDEARKYLEANLALKK